MKVIYTIYKSLVKLTLTTMQVINLLRKYSLWVNVQQGHRIASDTQEAML